MSEPDIIKKVAFQSISDYGWVTTIERITFLCNHTKTMLDRRPPDVNQIEDNFREIIESLFALRVIHDVKKLYYDLTGDKSIYKKDHHEKDNRSTSVIPTQLREISSNVYMFGGNYDKILRLMFSVKERKQIVLKSTYDKDLRYELNRLPAWQKEKADDLEEAIQRLTDENIQLNKRIEELMEGKTRAEKERDEMARRYMTTTRSLDNFRTRRSNTTTAPMNSDIQRPHSADVQTMQQTVTMEKMRKTIEKYRIKEYQKLVLINKPKQHVTFKFEEGTKTEQYDVDIFKIKSRILRFPKIKINEDTDELEVGYIEVLYEDLKKMKPIEKSGSEIIENNPFIMRINPHYSTVPEESPSTKIVTAVVPIGVILTGGNVKVNVEGKEVGIKIPQGCEDGFETPFTNGLTLKVKYEESENWAREGDDLIGTIIYGMKDSGKITTMPYPTEMDDLPPVHINEGKVMFKRFGFLNTKTGRKGNYILNILIQ